MHVEVDPSKCHPNGWNPNHLPPDMLVKLEEGMRQTLAQAGRLPPITVRPHPTLKGEYEIIDGYHRWSLHKKLKRNVVDAYVINVDDSLARILTSTLNYIRGEADPEKYPMLVAEAIKANTDLTVDDLAKLLPETADMLVELIESSDLAVDALRDLLEQRKAEKDAEGGEDEKPEERFVALNFMVPLEVATIIEGELDRIASTLTGKARRMRALEFMAVNSSLTPLEEVQQTIGKKHALQQSMATRAAAAPYKEAAQKAAAPAPDVDKALVEEELRLLAESAPKASKKPSAPPTKKKPAAPPKKKG